MSEVQKLILAVPTGRILKQLLPILEKIGVEPQSGLQDERSSKHRFATNIPGMEIIRVKPFDVPTWVGFGAAQLGIAGSDALMEYTFAQPQRASSIDMAGFDSDSMYVDVDLKIGRCRLSVAQPDRLPIADLSSESGVRVATKYPNVAEQYFNARSLSVTHVALTGAMELAPGLGMADYILDIVDTGKTLEANGLKVIADVASVTSRLIVNRIARKTIPEEMNYWIGKFRAAVEPNISLEFLPRKEPSPYGLMHAGRY